jgi:cytochrome c556
MPSDLADTAQKAKSAMSNAWNSMLQQTSLETIAPAMVNLELAAKALTEQEDQGAGKREKIPDIRATLLNRRSLLTAEDSANLTPFERLKQQNDLKAIGAGLDAADEVASEENWIRESKPVVEISPLNVEFVNEAILRSWVSSMAARDALPENPELFRPFLEMVEKRCHADQATRSKLAEAWAQECPNVDPDGLAVAASALLASACSSRLETVETSATDAVREILAHTYKEMESRRARLAGKAKPEAPDDSAEIKELTERLPTLARQLAHVERDLANGSAKSSIQDLLRTMDRVTERVQAISDGALESEGAGEIGPRN